MAAPTKTEMRNKEGLPKGKRLRVGDPDFEPPDGGWGWLILFACGFSNLSTFPMLQQFGIVFREKFNMLGITNPETTTIINLNSAATACMGLLNGPLFRRFSYRQMALFGSFLASTSLFFTSFASSFWWFLILYSLGYGIALGITQSSNALALNTYFKKKRRIAAGLSWTTTGMGPIICPYIITALIGLYGMEWNLAIFAAFSTHAIACALLLQPVHWHTRIRGDESTKPLLNDKPTDKDESGYLSKGSKPRSLFSSQYMFPDDDRFSTGYEMTDPGTPMMIRANDGWYSQKSSLVGSRVSLSSNKAKSRLTSGQNSVAISKRPSYNNLIDARKKKITQSKLAIREHVAEDCPTEKAPQDLREEEKVMLTTNVDSPVTYPNEKDVLKTAAKKLARYKEIKEGEALRRKILIEEQRKIEEEEKLKRKSEQQEEEVERKYTFFERIIIFFDLNLLKDYVYVNLMIGITISNFVELNFSILTPYVLIEFNFEKYEIATFMSLLGAADVACRFVVPLLADKIGWENKTFFLFGVMSMAIGRVILVHTQTYKMSILVAMIIGFGKGLRTVFMALVIPSHVPLEKLPAASGLQLTASGILFLVMGPVVGWIRDTVDNYVITLHILNILTYITAVAWTTEKILKVRKERAKKANLTEA